MGKSSCSISVMNKDCSSGSRFMVVDSSPEESGWTLYFEDFLCSSTNNNISTTDQENKNIFSTSDYEICSPSVFDAASSASSSAVPFSLKTCCRNSSFKKRSRSACIISKGSFTVAADDSLEDTASSPVNSPKISNLTGKDTMNTKEKTFAHIMQENNSAQDQSAYSTELKRRGLCLVPVSTIANYIG